MHTFIHTKTYQIKKVINTKQKNATEGNANQINEFNIALVSTILVKCLESTLNRHEQINFQH